MRKKVFLILTAVLVGGVTFWYATTRPARKKEEIKTTKVRRGALVQTVSASGKIRAQTEVNLKFQTSGKLAWVGVKEGDYVKKGQAVASLDKRELQKKLERELADYLGERWDFDQAHDDHEVVLNDTIKRILDKAQFDLNKAVLDVEIADLALKLATLVSPIEGIITRIDTPVAGVNITPATAVFTVSQPDNLVFVANIDEVDIGKIGVGQAAEIVLDTYPEEELKGEVKKISFVATTTRGGGTAFEVEISLPPNTPEQKFKLGMNGDVEIILEEKEKALVVPSRAVMKRGEKYYVFVIKGGVAKKKEVGIGLETETETEIIKGVSEGDEIVAENLSKIREGQKII